MSASTTLVERASAIHASGVDPWPYIAGYLAGCPDPVVQAEVEKAIVSAERYAAQIIERRAPQAQDRDPADYGYPASGLDLAPAEPHEVYCRSCGRRAIEHTPGRFSIYGVCPAGVER